MNSDYDGPTSEAILQGFTDVTIGPTGTTYPIGVVGDGKFNGDLGLAVTQFGIDNKAAIDSTGIGLHGIIERGDYAPSTRGKIAAGTTYYYLSGRGMGVTRIRPPRNSGAGLDLGPAWLSCDGLSTPTVYKVDKITFSGARQTVSPAAPTTNTPTPAGSTYTYVHGTAYSGAAASVRAVVKVSGLTAANVNSQTTTLNGTKINDPSGHNASCLVEMLGNGIKLNLTDSLVVVTTDPNVVFQWQVFNAFWDFDTAAWLANAESSARVVLEEIETTSATHIGFAGGNPVTLATNVTTISGTVNASVTTIPLAAAGGVVTNFYILSDTEYMFVRAGGGSTSLTVDRGMLGSTAASHTNSNVTIIFADGMVGSNGSLGSANGAEDAEFRYCKMRTAGALECRLNNGAAAVIGGEFYQTVTCGVGFRFTACEVGTGGFVFASDGPNGSQTYDLDPKFMNGVSNGGYGDCHMNAGYGASVIQNLNIKGGSWALNTGGTSNSFVTGTSTAMATCAISLDAPTFVCGASATAVICATPNAVTVSPFGVDGTYGLAGSTSITTFWAGVTQNLLVSGNKSTGAMTGPAPTTVQSGLNPVALNLTTTSAKMLGINATATDRWLGLLHVHIEGTIATTVGADGLVLQLRRATSAFGNGAAASGTVRGSSKTFTITLGNSDGFEFSFDFIDTSTVAGTAYFYDVSVANVVSASTTATATGVDSWIRGEIT